jgi:hypothetical protein
VDGHHARGAAGRVDAQPVAGQVRLGDQRADHLLQVTLGDQGGHDQQRRQPAPPLGGQRENRGGQRADDQHLRPLAHAGHGAHRHHQRLRRRCLLAREPVQQRPVSRRQRPVLAEHAGQPTGEHQQGDAGQQHGGVRAAGAKPRGQAGALPPQPLQQRPAGQPRGRGPSAAWGGRGQHAEGEDTGRAGQQQQRRAVHACPPSTGRRKHDGAFPCKYPFRPAWRRPLASSREARRGDDARWNHPRSGTAGRLPWRRPWPCSPSSAA